MPDKSPGQAAYAAYWQASLRGRPQVHWERLHRYTQERWEAAAQAVLGMQAAACPHCGAHDLAQVGVELAGATRRTRPMGCEDCGATWGQVYTLVGVEDVRPPGEETP